MMNYDAILRAIGVTGGQITGLLLREAALLGLTGTSLGIGAGYVLALGLLSTQPILVVDEPFDGLDLRQTREMMQLLRAHATSGRTIFVSIHQLNDAAKVCDRLVLLAGGRIAGEGTLEELQRQTGLSEGGLEEVFLALT